MFSKFFYTLKDKGLDVSLSVWLTLQDALDRGLCNSSLLLVLIPQPLLKSVFHIFFVHLNLLLMDSGGTMIPYTTLLNELFHSVYKSNHSREIYAPAPGMLIRCLTDSPSA